MESILLEWASDQQIQLKEMEKTLMAMQSQLSAVFIGHVVCVVVFLFVRVFNYKRSKTD